MARILVLHASEEGQTEKIAGRVAEVLEQQGHRVTVAPVRSAPGFLGFDAVLLGASIHAGRYAGYLHQFVRTHSEDLEKLPTAFFTVCLTASGKDEDSRRRVDGYLQDFLAKTGWRPVVSTSFAGAIRYSRYGFLKRQLMKAIARREGQPTDTSRDHEFTDWSQVEGFARTVAERLAAVAA